MRITEPQYREAYRCARLVYDEPKRMRVTDAKRQLEKVGLNPNSALDFVYIFRHMLRGEIYKRAMSEEATEDFVLWIRRDYGEKAFQNALSALGKHIPYKGGKMTGHVAILEKYQVAGSREELRNAADDLDEPPKGNEHPDRAKRISYVSRTRRESSDTRVEAVQGSVRILRKCGASCFLAGSDMSKLII